MTRPLITIADARPAPQTAAPAIDFRLRISVEGARVQAMALRCHVRIDARRRRHALVERERLSELFGDESQFERALRPITWAQAAVVVPTFEGAIECNLAVACTYDLEVGTTKYLHAVREGTVPLLFLFSGTMFRVDGTGTLVVEPVGWDLEASYDLPARVWRDTMDRFFPGGGWLRVKLDTIDRLQAFRGRAALVTWDQAIEALLERAEAGDPV